MDIKVLGPGCARCEQLKKDVDHVLAEMGVTANVAKLKDVKAIMAYNIMQTPALVINDKVKVFGRVPSKADIKRYISEEMD